MHHWPLPEGPKKPFLGFNAPLIYYWLEIPGYTFVRLPQLELCACRYDLTERYPECLENANTPGELRQTLRAGSPTESCISLLLA